MSKTKKGAKGPGFEYWGKRGGKRHGMEPGPYSKDQTHRAERRDGKSIVDEAPREPEYDEREYVPNEEE